MRQAIDVHKTRERYDRAVKRLKVDDSVSERNRKTILRFIWDLQAQGIGLPRLMKYLYLLAQVARGCRKRKVTGLNKDFEKATKDDIKHFLGEVNQSNYANWTKSDFRVTLKRFYRWLRDLPDAEDPPETKWIKIGNGMKQILPEELLMEEDILKMLQVCENSRDRAFLLCVDETGGRIGELLNLRRRHVRFDDYGAVLSFSGKTGDRPVRIVAGAPSLAQWMNDNSEKNPDSPLWIIIGDKNHGEPLLYDPARKLLQRLAKRGGVKKRVNPQSFRHSRSSRLASVLTERQMEKYLGWVPGSKMPRVYVHLSGRDVDPAILRIHGLDKDTSKPQTPKLTVLTCPRCNQRSNTSERFCGKCGLPLRIEAALELEETRKEADLLMNTLLEDPEVKTLLVAKLKQLMQRKVVTAVPEQEKPEPLAPAAAV